MTAGSTTSWMNKNVWTFIFILTKTTLLEQTALGLANKHTNRVFIRQRRLENSLAKFCLFCERTLPLDNNPPVTLLHSILLLLQFFMKTLTEAHFFSFLCFIFYNFSLRNWVTMHILIGQKHAWLSLCLLVNSYLHHRVVQGMQREGKPWSLH